MGIYMTAFASFPTGVAVAVVKPDAGYRALLGHLELNQPRIRKPGAACLNIHASYFRVLIALSTLIF